MNEIARQGFYNGSPVPFGYRTEEVERRGARIKKRLAVDPLEAEFVKAAIEGRLPRGFGVKRLIDLPMLWSEQWAELGLRAPASDH